MPATLASTVLDQAAAAVGHASNLLSGSGEVLLVDFETYKPADELRIKLHDVLDSWTHGDLAGGRISPEGEYTPAPAPPIREVTQEEPALAAPIKEVLKPELGVNMPITEEEDEERDDTCPASDKTKPLKAVKQAGNPDRTSKSWVGRSGPVTAAAAEPASETSPAGVEADDLKAADAPFTSKAPAATANGNHAAMAMSPAGHEPELAGGAEAAAAAAAAAAQIAIAAAGTEAAPLLGTAAASSRTYTPEEIQDAKERHLFELRVFRKSGLSGDRTHLPRGINPRLNNNNFRTDLVESMAECKMVLCGAVEGLLSKVNMRAQDVDILVTICSIYCPTPSMASMVVNHFGMKPSIQSYHLGGMGCANGVVAVNLIRDLLKARPNCNAVLACTETVTPAYYAGRDKHRVVTNVLFRLGASAMLFSNKRSWQHRNVAKYVLQKSIRVHIGTRDEAYQAIQYSPDDEGIPGIYLGKNVVVEATKALTMAMTKIGPYILTPRQLLEAAWYYAQKHMGRGKGKPFQPCFAEGIQHFLIHAGGAKVLDGIGTALQLNEAHLEPSRAVLFDFGNVSSSTTWYSLSFIETVRGVRKGDKVLQIGVGSGIKCGINVFKALRNTNDLHTSWASHVSDERRAALVQAGSSGQGALNRMYQLLLQLLLLSVVVAVVAVVVGAIAAHG